VTNRTLPQGAEDGFRADIKAQRKQASRAVLLLEQAVTSLQVDEPDEASADKAQRMRGAAVLATSAALELAVTCGWLEAAHAAELCGLLDESASND
jgi:hypothetical protein